MQTVNFQCGHCGNLMAVSENYLGQQVRCPHCQQVVLAPAAPAPAPAPVPAFSPSEPVFSIPTPGEHDSIFGPVEGAGEDLFGDAGPKVEMPPEQPAWMAPPQPVPTQPPAWMQAPQEVTLPAPQSDPAALLEPTITFPASPAVPELAPAPPQESPAFTTQPAADWQASPAPEQTAEYTADESLADVGRRPSYQSRSGGWGVALFIIPLISYSILATIAVLILYFRPPPPHPLEMMPDVIGDEKNTSEKVKPKGSSSIIYDRVKPDTELPAKLKVALGHPLQIGALEVTPVKVELRKIQFRTQGREKLEPGTDNSLVLQLHLKNTSHDQVFCPTDPAFDRQWKRKGGSGGMPYTYLEVGGRVFCGPIEWRPQDPNRGSRFTEPRTTVEGQIYGKRLNPGEEMMTFVCTDPDDHVATALERTVGPLLWRVQVRRGLVEYRDRDVSTTAVVGVEFTKQDVQHGS